LVRVDFHAAKDASNQAKHGVSLALAEQLDWDAGRVAPARTVGGEERWKMLVASEGVVYAVIFTRRADVLSG
jgi:uncharacterized protein